MYDDLGALLEGVDDGDGDDSIFISGDTELDQNIGAALRLRSPRAMLSTVSRFRPSAKAPGKVTSLVSRLGKISKQVLVQTGRIEAEYMRRPNTLAGIYTTSLASGASVAFVVQPGSGMSYYRVLGFLCTDEQANIFGFTSLKVGGVEHVNQSQTTPTAPVSNAVSWALYAYREGRMVANLAPWSGQVFDSNTVLQGTIANMTVAATGDAVTVAARIVILCQTDPCGQRYTQAAQNAARTWGTLRQNIGAYAPLFVGG